MTAAPFPFDVESPSDSSSTTRPRRHINLFEYDPKTFFQRLLVSFRFKTNLDTSTIIFVNYNHSYKYCLILLLLLIAAFLTPQLLPRWIGFEWATPHDLCRQSSAKLEVVHDQLRNYSQIDEAYAFLETQNHTLQCMNASSAAFYHGNASEPHRFLWPDECDSEKANVSLKETTCVGGGSNHCSFVTSGSSFSGGTCVRDSTPPTCTTTSNKERSKALLELERNRDANLRIRRNITESPVLSTANSHVQKLISRIITQVDFASDAFILYSLLSIAIGIPLIVYRREYSSRVVNATFGLTKVWFIVIFVVIASIYDSAALLFEDANFSRLFSNFLKDPCYVDPQFSARRIGLILELCNNISKIDAHSDLILQDMDAVYYDTRLFGFCKDSTRELATHPRLDEMDRIRKAYRTKKIANPGICNATDLNTRTAAAPNSESTWKALLGSGVIAQLALKFILTSWLMHSVAYVEPMVLHNGKVELWGAKKDIELSEDEKEAIKRFARDKHLFGMLFFSMLMMIEVVLVIYSIFVTTTGGNQIQIAPNSTNATQPFAVNNTCSQGLRV